MKDFLKEPIRFVMRTEILTGSGIVSEKLSETLIANNWKRVGCIVDKTLLESNKYAELVTQTLQAKIGDTVVFPNEMPEPSYDYLNEVDNLLKSHDFDCIIGIGGGSTIDLAKGLAVLKTNEGEAIQFRGFGKVTVPPLSVIGIPTTAGSGSEVTPYAVFIDTDENWKFGINTEHNYPRISFLDSDFLKSCPERIFASAGMDALTHSLESFAAKNATDMSIMFSLKAFTMLFRNLNRIADGDRDQETLMGLLLGADMAGIALMNSGAGPAGALSYPLGVYFDVPHGLAGSVFLPGVITHNVEQGYSDYWMLYDQVFPNQSLSHEEKSHKFADSISTLSCRLGIPGNLNGFGVETEQDRSLIVENSMQLKAAFEQNPVPFGQEEIARLIKSLS